MAEPGVRVIGVDWSGDQSGGAKQIWLAEARHSRITRLESGRTRDQVTEHLIDQGVKTPHIVVGLDFAFSMPRWFVERHGAADGPEFWNVVAESGEDWLHTCPWPFYGKHGIRKPSNVELLRRTEKEVAAEGKLSASSVFLLAGSKQVGTGSIRGMPHLARLRRSGWHVWPFDPPGFPMVIEIFPRLFMGHVVKTSCAACLAFLEARFPPLEPDLKSRAASNHDAFDATVSALVMAENSEVLRNLPWPVDEIDAVEGQIWKAPP
jgi:hypothetical protein